MKQLIIPLSQQELFCVRDCISSYLDKLSAAHKERTRADSVSENSSEYSHREFRPVTVHNDDILKKEIDKFRKIINILKQKLVALLDLH